MNELDDLRVAGGVVGDVVAQVWRDEFSPRGQWRTFTEFALVEADRLRGVLDDLASAISDARTLVTDVEARAGWSDHVTEVGGDTEPWGEGFRGECSCGWASGWTANDDDAHDACDKHRNRAVS